MATFFDEQELEKHTGADDPAAALRRRIAGCGKPVYFFGAGLFGRAYYDYCLKTLLPNGADGILDNNPALAGKTVHGLPVSPPDAAEVRERDPLVVILAGQPTNQVEMGEQCRRLGYECVTTDAVVLSHTRPTAARRIEDEPEAKTALEVWADDESRAAYRAVLRTHATMDEADLPPIETRYPQYFHPGFAPDRYRAFVDAGAHVGDTLRAFRARVGDAFDHYYAFEPHPAAFPKLVAEAGGDPRIVCRDEVVMDDRRMVSFREWGFMGTGSRVMEGGEERRGDSLDHLLAGMPVTCVKMDIEGGEPAALEGAKELIRKQRPALAVCTYHDIRHHWELPLWIKRLEPSYRLFFARHGPGPLETVCYAVPG